MARKKETDKVAAFMQFDTPDTEKKDKKKKNDIDDDARKEIERNAVDAFVNNLNLVSLFQQDEQEQGLMKFVPIANLVLLVILLFIK